MSYHLKTLKKFQESYEAKPFLLPSPFEFAKNQAQTLLEMKLENESKILMLDMYYQNYQNLSKSAHRPPQISFYRGFFESKKWPGTSFQAIFSM